MSTGNPKFASPAPQEGWKIAVDKYVAAFKSFAEASDALSRDKGVMDHNAKGGLSEISTALRSKLDVRDLAIIKSIFLVLEEQEGK